MHRLAVLVAVMAFVAAACSGRDDAGSAVASLSGETDTTAAATEATEPVDQEAAMLELTECLRANGIDIADPTVDAAGNVQLGRPDFAEDGGEPGRGGGVLREAFEACGELMEGVTLGFRGEADPTAREDQLLEFAQCMRDNGYDMPDPDFSAAGPGSSEGEGPGQGGGPFGPIDRDDPAFQTAQSACEDILAGFGPGGGRFGGGPGGDGDEG